MTTKLINRQIVLTLIGEVMFATAPIIMVFVVSAQHHPAKHVFASPEWAIAAVILCGQALVKFQIGLMHGPRASTGAVSVTLIVLLFLGLMPAFLVLYRVLEAQEGEQPHAPEGWIQVAQVVSFLVGAVVYLVLGAIGDAWRHLQDD